MAEIQEDLDYFWLPSKLTSDRNMLMEKRGNLANTALRSNINFPAEFPYEFDLFGPSSALNSPIESVVSSTETENSEEDNFFVGLTQRLAQYSLHETQKATVPCLAPNRSEKQRNLISVSPQSTLGGIGRWSGAYSQGPSPPTSPLGAENDAWDLIYAAAGQVARMKISGHDHLNRGMLRPVPTPVRVSCVNNQNSRLHLNNRPPQKLTQSAQLEQARIDRILKTQFEFSWGRQSVQGIGRSGLPLGLPQSACPPLQTPKVKHRSQAAVMRPALPGGGSVAKRESAGTGVFLPRLYTNPPEPRKKSGCPTVVLPAKVVQALNLSFDEMKVPPQTTLNGDAMVARRNTLLAQQRQMIMRSEAARLSHEICLPQDWTY